MEIKVIKCKQGNNHYYGEARIAEADYEEAGNSEICKAIAQQCDETGGDPDSVRLTGFDNSRDIVHFEVR